MKIKAKTTELTVDISNYNLPKDCCVESYCDKKATRYIELNYQNLDFFLMFCDDHASIFDYQSSNQTTRDGE